MTDLLPCPFCGEMPKYYPDPGGGGPYIFCENDAGCYVRPSVWPKLAGRGVNIVSAWNRRAAPQWQPIATAPRDETLFLATGLDGGSGPDRHVAIVFCDGAGFFDDFDEYTYLTHWMPLPAPPVDSSAATSAPVDNKISADPVGKEG